MMNTKRKHPKNQINNTLIAVNLIPKMLSSSLRERDSHGLCRGSQENAVFFQLYQDFISRESCDPFLYISNHKYRHRRGTAEEEKRNRTAYTQQQQQQRQRSCHRQISRMQSYLHGTFQFCSCLCAVVCTSFVEHASYEAQPNATHHNHTEYRVMAANRSIELIESEC